MFNNVETVVDMLIRYFYGETSPLVLTTHKNIYQHRYNSSFITLCPK